MPYIIETYEGLSMSDRRYLKVLDDINGHKLMIIADESIFIKNGDSKRHNRTMKIAGESEYRLILNGTPITKNEWDVYYQMAFLSPRIINMDESQFLQTFFKKIEAKKRGRPKKTWYEFSEVNINALKKMIEPFVFEVDLEIDVKEVNETELITASVDTRNEYNELAEQLFERIEDGEGFFDLLSIMQVVMFTDKERCKEIAEIIGGQEIVYCSYLKEMEYIAKYKDCYVINGSTHIDDRQKILEQFKNDDKPLLMTYGVGAYGHNLQFCNRITFASITYDYGKVDQAMYRIKRLGQERDVYYCKMRSDLGIYNMIDDNLFHKNNLHDLLIKNLSEIKEMVLGGQEVR